MEKAVLERAKKEKRTLLTEVESKQVLEKAGISIVKAKLAASAIEAVAISKELGFPVVLKIASPDIVHKSDIGGVKVGLSNATQVTKAYKEIMTAVKKKEPKARIHGVSVQAMAKPGVEVIIGMTKDPQFGPVMVFGLGGIMVEVIKDVSLRIAPLSP